MKIKHLKNTVNYKIGAKMRIIIKFSDLLKLVIAVFIMMFITFIIIRFGLSSEKCIKKHLVS